MPEPRYFRFFFPPVLGRASVTSDKITEAIKFIEDHRGLSCSTVIQYCVTPEQFKQCSIDCSEDNGKLYEIDLREKRFRDLAGIGRRYKLELFPAGNIRDDSFCTVRFDDKSKRDVPYTAYDKMLHPEIARNLQGRVSPEVEPMKVQSYQVKEVKKPIDVATTLGLVQFLNPYGFGKQEILPKFQRMESGDIQESGLPTDRVSAFGTCFDIVTQMSWYADGRTAGDSPHVPSGEFRMSPLNDKDLKSELVKIFGIKN
jgi:hypothetical protein